MCINRFLPVLSNCSYRYVYKSFFTGLCISNCSYRYVYKSFFTGLCISNCSYRYKSIPLPVQRNTCIHMDSSEVCIDTAKLVWIYREDGINGLRFIAWNSLLSPNTVYTCVYMLFPQYTLKYIHVYESIQVMSHYGKGDSNFLIKKFLSQFFWRRGESKPIK